MGILSVGLTFIGYLLVYASVANHGAFALQPWLGITADAYEGDTSGSPDSSGGQTGASLPLPATGGSDASSPSPSTKPPLRTPVRTRFPA